ncbi:hypothetical protein PG994_002719 [Apiospora phragmitis]|uniref:BTB domain-containing protein n=1 Tax=Apiospora phragmitis TaxID=2905665 RepID=A0ABR1W654_9PEZI
MDTTPKPCPPIPEPVTKVLDADGDLVLRAGTTKCDFSVWRKLLYGDFAESNPKEGDWIVNLPDDLPQTMSMLLGIIHTKFDDVPYSFRPEELYKITVLTDKDDLTHILKPWHREGDGIHPRKRPNQAFGGAGVEAWALFAIRAGWDHDLGADVDSQCDVLCPKPTLKNPSSLKDSLANGFRDTGIAMLVCLRQIFFERHECGQGI